ncbi:hypothetical protein [Mycolicibacterium thermoresistibile]
MASGSTRGNVPVSDRPVPDYWHDTRRADDAPQRDGGTAHALRFGLGCAGLGIALLAIAAVWVSTCSGNTIDVIACGRPQLTLLAMCAPAVLAAGGLWAFVRSYRCWRRDESWWAWLAAGWFLLTVTLVVAMMSLPTFTYPAIGM